MKKLLLTLILAFVAVPAIAADTAKHHHADSWLKQVEAKHVCMMNNQVFDKDLTAVEVDGKTYYGCCPMCADKLKGDVSLRTAIDPVSSKTVDKATAVIGEHGGTVYYFENDENFHKFASGPMPKMDEHHEGMNHDMKNMEKDKTTDHAPADHAH